MKKEQYHFKASAKYLLKIHLIWREKTFWSDGYFVCSTGNANMETIKKYIETQG